MLYNLEEINMKELQEKINNLNSDEKNKYFFYILKRYKFVSNWSKSNNISDDRKEMTQKLYNILEILIKYIDINSYDSNGLTPIIIASSGKKTIYNFNKFKVILLLIKQKNIDINKKTKDGRHILDFKINKWIRRQLIKKGVDTKEAIIKKEKKKIALIGRKRYRDGKRKMCGTFKSVQIRSEIIGALYKNNGLRLKNIKGHILPRYYKLKYLKPNMYDDLDFKFIEEKLLNYYNKKTQLRNKNRIIKELNKNFNPQIDIYSKNKKKCIYRKGLIKKNYIYETYIHFIITRELTEYIPNNHKGIDYVIWVINTFNFDFTKLNYLGKTVLSTALTVDCFGESHTQKTFIRNNISKNENDFLASKKGRIVSALIKKYKNLLNIKNRDGRSAYTNFYDTISRIPGYEFDDELKKYFKIQLQFLENNDAVKTKSKKKSTKRRIESKDIKRICETGIKPYYQHLNQSVLLTYKQKKNRFIVPRLFKLKKQKKNFTKNHYRKPTSNSFITKPGEQYQVLYDRGVMGVICNKTGLIAHGDFIEFLKKRNMTLSYFRKQLSLRSKNHSQFVKWLIEDRIKIPNKIITQEEAKELFDSLPIKSYYRKSMSKDIVAEDMKIQYFGLIFSHFLYTVKHKYENQYYTDPKVLELKNDFMKLYNFCKRKITIRKLAIFPSDLKNKRIKNQQKEEYTACRIYSKNFYNIKEIYDSIGLSTIELENGIKGCLNSNPKNVPTFRILHNGYKKESFNFDLFFDAKDYISIFNLHRNFYYNKKRGGGLIFRRINYRDIREKIIKKVDRLFEIDNRIKFLKQQIEIIGKFKDNLDDTDEQNTKIDKESYDILPTLDFKKRIKILNNEIDIYINNILSKKNINKDFSPLHYHFFKDSLNSFLDIKFNYKIDISNLNIRKKDLNRKTICNMLLKPDYYGEITRFVNFNLSKNLTYETALLDNNRNMHFYSNRFFKTYTAPASSANFFYYDSEQQGREKRSKNILFQFHLANYYTNSYPFMYYTAYYDNKFYSYDKKDFNTKTLEYYEKNDIKEEYKKYFTRLYYLRWIQPGGSGSRRNLRLDDIDNKLKFDEGGSEMQKRISLTIEIKITNNKFNSDSIKFNNLPGIEESYFIKEINTGIIIFTNLKDRRHSLIKLKQILTNNGNIYNVFYRRNLSYLNIKDSKIIVLSDTLNNIEINNKKFRGLESNKKINLRYRILKFDTFYNALYCYLELNRDGEYKDMELTKDVDLYFKNKSNEESFNIFKKKAEKNINSRGIHNYIKHHNYTTKADLNFIGLYFKNRPRKYRAFINKLRLRAGARGNLFTDGLSGSKQIQETLMYDLNESMYIFNRKDYKFNKFCLIPKDTTICAVLRKLIDQNNDYYYYRIKNRSKKSRITGSFNLRTYNKDNVNDGILLFKFFIAHHHVDINKSGFLGHTPLILSIFIKDKKIRHDIVSIILSFPNIDVNKTDHSYTTPLWYAENMYYDKFIINQLKEKGAISNTKKI